jgi:long-chain fatty acid transport protein
VNLAPKIFLLAVLVVVGIHAPLAHAQMGQMYEDFGVGPRDVGMGNTGAASANDYSAAFYNPAALVRAKGLAVHMGYKGVYPKLHMKIGKFNDRYFTNYPNTNCFLMGLSWNLVIEQLINPKYTERFTFGVALSLSNFYKSFTVFYDADSPYFYRYHDRYLNLLPVYLSMSFRIHDWFSIGGGIVPAPSDTTTSVTVDSTISLPDYDFNATQGTITRSFGKIEPVVGLLLRIPSKKMDDAYSFGFVWRDQVSSIDGEGTATNYSQVEFEGMEIPLPPSKTPIITLTGWTPMNIVGAFSARPNPNMTIATDILWKRWSKWKNFFIEHPKPRFKDTLNARFGIENRFGVENNVLDSVTLRGGLYREFSPTPDQNGSSNYLDPDKWVFSLGLNTTWENALNVFQLPFMAQISGQAHLMDRILLHNNQDPDFPKLEAWGQVYNITATVGIAIE